MAARGKQARGTPGGGGRDLVHLLRHRRPGLRHAGLPRPAHAHLRRSHACARACVTGVRVPLSAALCAYTRERARLRHQSDKTVNEKYECDRTSPGSK